MDRGAIERAMDHGARNEESMEGEMVGIRWMDQGEMEGAMDQGASAGFIFTLLITLFPYLLVKS